jgi:predicted Fe-Mo cluster-binding NifX family protein
MKIAVTSLTNDVNGLMDSRFGRCQYIFFYDTDNDNFSVIQNSNANAGGGAGISTAQLIVDSNVEVVITGNCGPNAFKVLKAAEIKVYTNSEGTIKDTISKFKSNQLSSLDSENVPDHSGM